MLLIKRFGYFLFGLCIGLVILSFFLSGKKTSCNYGPEARVKSELLKKKYIDQNILIDSIIDLNDGLIKEFIKNSSVNFSKSDTSKDSCKIYNLSGNMLMKYREIIFENCTKTIKILNIKQ